MAVNFKSLFILAAIALALSTGPLLGCNKSSADATEADQDKEPKAEEPQAAEKAKPAAEKYPDDLYPGFNFGALESDERARFVEVAKAELCPCPGSAVSLHECLQKTSDRCMLAEQSATIVAMSIKEGLNQTDVLNKLAENIEAARKTHEFNLDNTPFKGGKTPKVVVVEFADFECPFCREAAKMMSNANKKFGDDVAIYFKHFPLSAHPNARLAAQAASAAQLQGKFWPMHDMLFEHQRSLTPEKIEQLAQQAGLNFGKFQADMKSPAVIEKVSADRREGEEAKITGTPSIFINGVRYMGDRTEEAIVAAIQQALDATTTDQKK